MNYKILIVEDDEMIQGFLRLTLENENYVVTAASSFAEMRTLFPQNPYDLIILDLGLPDGDGLDLVSEIRSVSTVPILVSSARQGASDRVAALERGADDYLTKPFDPAEMILRLRNLLARCTAGQAAAQPSAGATNTSARSGGRRASDHAGPTPPQPPQINSGPVRPVTEPASTPEPLPGAAAGVVEPSLQAALKKSAPPPPPPQGKATGNIDKSVIIAGVLAILAFGGAGYYWYNQTMKMPTWAGGTNETVAERQDRLAGSSGDQQNNEETGQPPRRGGLQPPPEPDVPIARSAQQGTTDGLSRSATTGGGTQDLNSTNSLPSTVSRRQRESELAALPATPPAIVTDNRCDPLPDVKWWRVKTHQQIINFVDENHNGDWQPYLNNWRSRITKLQDIAERGSGIKTSTGEILQGESLAGYIRDTADRINIILCLSRESRNNN